MRNVVIKDVHSLDTRQPPASPLSVMSSRWRQSVSDLGSSTSRHWPSYIGTAIVGVIKRMSFLLRGQTCKNCAAQRRLWNAAVCPTSNQCLKRNSVLQADRTAVVQTRIFISSSWNWQRRYLISHISVHINSIRWNPFYTMHSFRDIITWLSVTFNSHSVRLP